MFSETDKSLKFIALLLGLIVTAILVVALRQLQSIIRPFLVAVLLSFLLGPFVELLTRKKVPMWLAMVIMVIILFTVLYLIGLLIYSSSNNFIEEFPKYEERVTMMMEDFLNYLNIPTPQAQEYINQLDWKSALMGAKLTTVLSTTLGSFFGFLGKLVMMIILLLFIIPGRNKLGDRLQRMFIERRAVKIQSVLESINSGVQLYLIAKTAISLATGILVTVVLLILGVDFAVMWGFFTFLLNFIPTIGSIIATIPPILVCFVQYGFGTKVLLVAILLTAIQLIMGNGVEPRVMGRRLNLSPLVVILSLIFWGWLWGVPGMILATPLASAFKIICENIEPLKPIAILMSSD